MGNNKTRNELFKILKKDSFFKKKVRLASGKMSNYYLDVRRASLGSQGINRIAALIWQEIKNDKPTAFGGPTLGADAIIGGVCLLADREGKKLKGFIVRKVPKKHGRQNLIEGKELTKKDKVILVDDVATSGGSLVKALKVLKDHKIKVIKAVVVIDREEGGREALAELGCPLVSLFKANEFLPR